MYNESSYLKHVVHRVRKDPVKLSRYEHNKEFVEFLNLFADKTQPLPRGWQMAKQGHLEQVASKLRLPHKTVSLAALHRPQDSADYPDRPSLAWGTETTPS